MIIFYDVEEKIFVDENYPSEKDPTTTEGKGITLVISQSYMAMRLPAAPLGGKITKFFSNTTGLEIPKDQWTAKMQSIAAEAKKNIKGTWKLWSLLIVIVCVLGSFFTAAKIIQFFQEKNTANQLELRLEPQPKDIVHLMYLDPETSWTAASAKISRIKEDTIFLKISDQREPIIQFDHDAAKKKLDTSDSMYDSKEEFAIAARSYKDDRTREGRIVFYNKSIPRDLPSISLKSIERK